MGKILRNSGKGIIGTSLYTKHGWGQKFIYPQASITKNKMLPKLAGL